MATSCQWIFELPAMPSSLPPSHQDLPTPGSHNTSSGPVVHISMRNHTSAHSFFVDLSAESFELPGPLLEVEVDVSSTTRTHEVRIKVPANLRQALATTTISAFRNLNQLIVHADSYEFRIKFSRREVDVAAASALVDNDGVLIIRVQRLSSWLNRLHARSLLYG
ncbi:hypothetical protein EI94DRAFT_834469 [Lactarius quietus]|nr:hypothetical protein EI94DRAFT_712725 [Lactarius quietus]KAF8270148.1 hypothetical protein EI94DRAFT_834469 [Lactarius quietus]